MKFSIAVMPGDGVGPEVTAEALKVLDAVSSRFGHVFDLSYGRVGGNAIDDFGTALPDETAAMSESTDAVLFGAVGGPKWDSPDAKTRPEDGMLALRKGMKVFANLRPVKVYPSPHQFEPDQTASSQGCRRAYRPGADRWAVFRTAQEALADVTWPPRSGHPPVLRTRDRAHSARCL